MCVCTNCGFLARGLILTAMIVLACLLKADRYVITEHFREIERGREGEFNRPVNTTQSHSDGTPTDRPQTVHQPSDAYYAQNCLANLI